MVDDVDPTTKPAEDPKPPETPTETGMLKESP
jgi:hypothetical protein